MTDAFCLAFLAWGLLITQLPATFILLSRLVKGANRRPPLRPQVASPALAQTVSVVIPTLNEVNRLQPCLQGLQDQGPEVREILVVDSRSQDGTRELVQTQSQSDRRVQLLTDDPLPPDWVGRPWALDYGFRQSSPDSEWILGIDADTQPQPGLVASVVQAALEENYDLLSLSPQFILRSPGEWWLQPALLMTLLYRFDSAGVRNQDAERVMANGQCFLVRRSLLVALDGYQCAAQSFCDDVTLARYAARQGYRVGFLDGAQVIRVRMYEGLQETWREWGRSLDLKDAASRALLWGDVFLLTWVQALPWLAFPGLALSYLNGQDFLTLSLALGLNGGLILIRFALLLAIAPSYHWQKNALSQLTFWLSPLADPLAVLRIYLSAQQQPKQWRGRIYGA